MSEDTKPIEESEKLELPYTIKLATPISIEGVETTELVIRRRLKARDFFGYKIDPNNLIDPELIIGVMSRLTGKSKAILGELDMASFMELSNVFAVFFLDSRSITT
jgi:hypothetical protein